MNLMIYCMEQVEKEKNQWRRKRESDEEEREYDVRVMWEVREKIIKKIKYKTTVTLYIYMVTVAKMKSYSVLLKKKSPIGYEADLIRHNNVGRFSVGINIWLICCSNVLVGKLQFLLANTVY